MRKGRGGGREEEEKNYKRRVECKLSSRETRDIRKSKNEFPYLHTPKRAALFHVG